jgi:glycosyltransferase involved in cell wall biosynthesis
MPDPLVSIIIPCYNSALWIAEAIHSALGQSWSNKEVIVIDDGSKDESLKVIQSFGDRIRWETGPNRGGCAARNRGIALARGEWVQFLDADDVLLPDCIEQKFRTPVKANQVCCCDVRSLDDAGSRRLSLFWNSPEYNLEHMLRYGTPQTAAPLHSLANLRVVGGFREGLKCAQERDLHLRMAAILGLEFFSTGKPGVLIRVQNESVSRSAGPKMPLAMADTMLRIVPLLRQHDRFSPTHGDIIAQRLVYLARKLWRMGLTDEASSIAGQARTLSPNWHKNAYKSSMAGMVARYTSFESFERVHGWMRALLGAKPDPY